MGTEMKCPICGESTSIYMGKARKDGLCREHGKQAKNGEIEQCPDCGAWKKTNQKCQCSKAKKNGVTEEITCLICGEPSNGKHFCLKCWNKYKDKSIDIRITHCNSTQILDEYGNKTKKAKDGRFVRSLSEKIILDYFFDNYIRVIYEKTIPYVNEKGEEKELHPDFYLKDHDLYIEFNGLTNKTYLKMKNYVNKIYQEKGLKVEILESSDIDDIETTMEKLLEKYPKK
jgi:hypothetical protein